MIAPAFETSHVRVYQGDALTVLREMPDGSVDCVVTSPPYSDPDGVEFLRPEVGGLHRVAHTRGSWGRRGGEVTTGGGAQWAM